jgi:hypothetical protein
MVVRTALDAGVWRMRPELLEKAVRPVSADACGSVPYSDKDSDARDAAQVRDDLVSVRLPFVAAELSRMQSTAVPSADTLKTSFHSHGVNLRLMPAVRHRMQTVRSM